MKSTTTTTKLFLGFVPRPLPDEQLLDYFARFCSTREAVSFDARQRSLFTNYKILNVTEREAAERILCAQHVLGKQTLICWEFRGEETFEEFSRDYLDRCVFLSGIPLAIDTDIIFDELNKFEPLLDLFVLKNGIKINKHYGFAIFKTAEGKARAIEKKRFKGRKFKISCKDFVETHLKKLSRDMDRQDDKLRRKKKDADNARSAVSNLRAAPDRKGKLCEEKSNADTKNSPEQSSSKSRIVLVTNDPSEEEKDEEIDSLSSFRAQKNRPVLTPSSAQQSPTSNRKPSILLKSPHQPTQGSPAGIKEQQRREITPFESGQVESPNYQREQALNSNILSLRGTSQRQEMEGQSRHQLTHNHCYHYPQGRDYRRNDSRGRHYHPDHRTANYRHPLPPRSRAQFFEPRSYRRTPKSVLVCKLRKGVLTNHSDPKNLVLRYGPNPRFQQRILETSRRSRTNRQCDPRYHDRRLPNSQEVGLLDSLHSAVGGFGSLRTCRGSRRPRNHFQDFSNGRFFGGVGEEREFCY